MKQLLFLLFVLGCSHSFSQSKKEQIEALNLRVDSLMRVIQNERNLNTQKVSTLETKVNQLNGQLTKLQEQIKQEKEKIKAKDAEMGILQAKLKLKTDSLSILQMELAKLKSAPKIETAEKFPEIVQIGNFKTVTIGKQVWMKENLNVSTFRNGDPIPEAKTEEEWKTAGEKNQPAWCYYDNDPANGEKYGKLYNLYALTDPRGLAPDGWHILTHDEWGWLCDSIGWENLDPIKSSYGWENDGNGIDRYNLSFLPSGSRSSLGIFGGADWFGYYWTIESYFHLSFDNLGRYWDEMDDIDSFGFSVRCIKD